MSLKENNKITGFELMYSVLGNMILFSFFMMQCFLPSLKIMRPKYVIVTFS